MKMVLLGLWCSFLVLTPLYLFPSGIPQVADYILLTLFIAVLVVSMLGFSLSTDRRSRRALSFLCAFTIYVMACSAAWFFITGEYVVLVPATWYLFNGLVFLAASLLSSKYGASFVRGTVWSVACVVFVMVVLAFLRPSLVGFRTSLFFNNPNQLGYFGLLSATIVAVRVDCVNRLVFILFLVATSLLIALSNSVAAMAAAGLLVLIVAVKKRSHFIPLAILGFMVFFWFGTTHRETLPSRVQDLVENVEERVRTTVDSPGSDESFEGRGYDRMWIHPQYLVFGAGEGAYYRFDSILTKEMHSGIANILFSYGAIGLCAFLAFIYDICRAAGMSRAVYLLPVAVYNVAHQGFRFRYFWVLLAVLCCVDSMTIGRSCAQAHTDHEEPRAP